jgi:hypothetical protein
LTVAQLWKVELHADDSSEKCRQTSIRSSCHVHAPTFQGIEGENPFQGIEGENRGGRRVTRFTLAQNSPALPAR